LLYFEQIYMEKVHFVAGLLQPFFRQSSNSIIILETVMEDSGF